MSEPFLAEVRIVGFNFPPRGWAKCDGQILPINQNQSLFSLLGTTYGGDGRTSFGLPDFRGRTPIHVGGGHALGQGSGSEAHPLAVHEMAPHHHTGRGTSDSAGESEPAGNLPAVAEGNTYRSATAPGGTNIVAMAATTTSTGVSQGHQNMQPYLTLNFVIALAGLFPSR